MTTWLPRGLLFAIGMVVLRVVQGSLIDASPTNSAKISFGLIGLFVIPALIWGVIDGMADARANPDPDRRRDLALRWLLAGLIAGVLSGLVTWIVSRFIGGLYVDGLGPELVVFPAFTALLIFIPATFGVGVGRFLVDRGRTDEPRNRGDHDVFDEVYEQDPNAKYAVSRSEVNWRQDAREAVRIEHEEAELRRHDHDR